VYRYIFGSKILPLAKLTVTGIAFGRTSGRKPAVIVGQIIGGGKLELDLPTLVDTRLLTNSGKFRQANSVRQIPSGKFRQANSGEANSGEANSGEANSGEANSGEANHSCYGSSRSSRASNDQSARAATCSRIGATPRCSRAACLNTRSRPSLIL
jgi:hypothetical protein